VRAITNRPHPEERSKSASRRTHNPDVGADAMTGNDVLLEVDGVTLQYKTKQHLVTATYRVGFTVHRGDRFIVLGPSGCGKSTLLKGVAGFLKPVEGSIRLNGKTIGGPGPDRMMVFQEFDQLLPWKTVKQTRSALPNSPTSTRICCRAA
jgi:sulfonate transport system ATP-binding protein